MNQCKLNTTNFRDHGTFLKNFRDFMKSCQCVSFSMCVLVCVCMCLYMSSLDFSLNTISFLYHYVNLFIQFYNSQFDKEFVQYLCFVFLVESIDDECGTSYFPEVPNRLWPKVSCTNPDNGIGPGGLCDKSDPQKHKCICRSGWKSSSDNRTCIKSSKNVIYSCY